MTTYLSGPVNPDTPGHRFDMVADTFHKAMNKLQYIHDGGHIMQKAPHLRGHQGRQTILADVAIVKCLCHHCDDLQLEVGQRQVRPAMPIHNGFWPQRTYNTASILLHLDNKEVEYLISAPDNHLTNLFSHKLVSDVYCSLLESVMSKVQEPDVK